MAKLDPRQIRALVMKKLATGKVKPVDPKDEPEPPKVKTY